MKNVLGQAGQIAGKTKNVESVTGLFKGITGKQGAEKLLSGVAVSNQIQMNLNIYCNLILILSKFHINRKYL